MAVLKCTICGGELEVNSELTVGVCKFCDSKIIIPKELDRKGNLYNRAVFLRQNNEFDKAASAYEDILREDNSDAEAHWGLVLSKYGIEYVSDPRTNQHIPTCHRTQAESILSDPDYLAALEYSDIEAQKIIEKEAKHICEIQKRILEISQKEPSYDIFICYKESDELGNRTEDSILAQELYYELVKKGYKVFFARKTLESKLGEEYEPIIYAALSSAKIMIVLGTKPDNFNAVWVRNEWSRFIKINRDTHKMVIPAYRGMAPYELPAELSALQSQDMSKIGFMQDLTDGIERFMRGEIRGRVTQQEVPSSSYGVAHLGRLLKNGETYLKLDNYDFAEEVYMTITKDYPEEHRGWWGLIVCKTRNFTDIVSDQTGLNLWFRYVKQLASHNEYAELEKQYIQYTLKIAEQVAMEDMRELNAKINTYNSQIQSINLQIKRNKAQIEQENLRYHDLKESDDDEISSYQMEIENAQNDYKKSKIMLFVGIIMSIIGIICLGFGGKGILLGVIIVFVGLMCALSLGDINAPQYHKESAQNSLLEAWSSKTVHKQEHDKVMADLNAQRHQFNNNITALQNKISEGNNYLNLGKDKIATYWLAEKCQAFGVEQAVDSQIIEYREIAFDTIDNAQEETVTISCPACGEQIIETRSELIEKGDVVCRACGNIIEVDTSDSTSDDEQSDANVYYEITCYWCGEEFNIDSSDLESEHCDCPICGALIDLRGEDWWDGFGS